MSSPSRPDRPSSAASDPGLGSEFQQEFEQELSEIERSLQELKTRYTQVQHDQQTQRDLRQQRDQLQQQLKQSPSPELRSQLKQLGDRLDELAVNLESQLFSWGSLREPFWQIVRFSGVGIIVGWSLAWTAFHVPKPPPSPSSPTSYPSSLGSP